MFVIVMLDYFGSSREMELFIDNGNRMKLSVGLDEWEKIRNRELEDCTDQNLVTCRIDKAFVDCFHCNQALASCVHFSNDVILHNNLNEEIGKVPKNENENEGYCLRLAGTDARKCTERNGGKWLLSKLRDGHYAYVCHCTTPTVFDRTSPYSDCTDFRGCMNGKLNENWSSLDNMTCDCNDGYSPSKNGPMPICERNNIFKDSDSMGIALPKDMVDPKYRGREFTLPNPCLIDARTGNLAMSGGKLEYDASLKVAYCVSMSPSYATIAFDDDYLYGNGGRYANAIYSVSTVVDETMDKMYETHTKRKDGSLYPTFVGYAHKLENFIPKLPYLDDSSRNMGGNGAQYEYAAFIDYRENAKVYVYNAEIPSPTEMPIGNFISYLPTLTYAFNSDYPDYNGNLPFVDIKFRSCKQHIIVKLGLSGYDKYPQVSAGGIESLNGRDETTNSELLSRYIAAPFCKKDIYSKDTPNPYTKTFTGIYSNRFIKGKVYTSPVSTGNYLTTLYRKQFDENWVDWKPTAFGYISTYCPTLAWHDENAGRLNDQYDCNGVSMPTKTYTPYDCTHDTFSWHKRYPNNY